MFIPPLPPAEIQHGCHVSLPPLYAVTVISNPARWNSRYQLYHEFAHRMQTAGVILYTVELAYGHRPFAITKASDPRHVQLRTEHELWHKENLINIGINRMAEQNPDWKYVAWIDADVHFNNLHWVNETIQQLQHYQIVQMWCWAQELDGCFNPLPHSHHRGFMYGWRQNPSVKPVAGPQGTGSKQLALPYCDVKTPQGGSLYHPGYAWAARREAIDGLGGLIDFAIMGQGDYHMAQCLVRNYTGAMYPKIHPNYVERIHAWQDRADQVVNGSVGYVDGMLTHYWHGKKQDRRYWDRNKVLIGNDYNPNTDIVYDHRGVLKLAGNKPGLRDGLMGYFRERNEDALT